MLLTLGSEATLTSETPEGSVFELTAGKASEGRPRGFGSPTQPPPRRGGFVPDIPHGYLILSTSYFLLREATTFYFGRAATIASSDNW
jgi:hypothetical protein